MANDDRPGQQTAREKNAEQWREKNCEMINHSCPLILGGFEWGWIAGRATMDIGTRHVRLSRRPASSLRNLRAGRHKLGVEGIAPFPCCPEVDGAQLLAQAPAVHGVFRRSIAAIHGQPRSRTSDQWNDDHGGELTRNGALSSKPLCGAGVPPRMVTSPPPPAPPPEAPRCGSPHLRGRAGSRICGGCGGWSCGLFSGAGRSATSPSPSSPGPP